MENNMFPSFFLLNGEKVRLKDLLCLKAENLLWWKKEFLEFLKQWYSAADFITVHTSGSTGSPKEICLKKEFVANSAIRTINYFHLNEGDRVLHCLPTRYIAGKLMIVRALIGKIDLYIADPSDPLYSLENYDFEFAAMVPNQVIKILDSTDGEKKLQHIHQLLLGGSSIPLSLEKRLSLSLVLCYVGYAMTETATHIAICALNGSDAGEWYSCMDNVKVELSDKGCLKIYEPGLPGGFLQTTDLAELKDNSTFRILGRSDNIIILGGIKFSPELIEKKIEKEISQSFMISCLSHENLGQQLVMIIEGSRDEGVKQNIERICYGMLDKYEVPRQFIFICKIPQTPGGKPDRSAVKKYLLSNFKS
ncbi:MAG: AMP-binding protein [Prolixibacteraceae bacterium]|nr:AMP-binding protein [Prolixibacteraceae bacterium]